MASTIYLPQALVDLNYHENKLAKVLANGKSEFVGILLPNLFLHYYSEMLNQLLAMYETFGYKFLVFVGLGAEETERKYFQELLAYKIEGLIVLSHTIPSRELAAFDINLLMRDYRKFPDDYRIIGFDDSPIASEAIIPISTVGQQIDKIASESMALLVSQMNERKKRKPSPQTEIIHKKITPILVRRDTTG